MSAGKWGYRTVCSSINLQAGNSLNTEIARGYYDDFTFDFGWTVSGTSPNAWERGDPNGTYDDFSNEINPENDVTGDCNAKCFVTDNGTGTFSSHDVDNGNTVLTSPVFDATIYQDPHINYSSRFLNVSYSTDPANDTMKISLSNGISTVVIETFDPNSPMGSWFSSDFLISSFITPTNTMQLSVEITDYASGTVLEGAFDLFEVTGPLIDGINKPEETNISLTAYPNPFNDEILIQYNLKKTFGKSFVTVKDVLGKEVFKSIILDQSGNIRLGKNLSKGIYFLSIFDNLENRTMKLIKE
jgi:hypothetical protein